MPEPSARWTCSCGRSNFSRSYPCMECGEPPPGGLELDTPASGGSAGPSDRFPAGPAGPAPDPQWTPPPGWVAPAHWSPPAAAPATTDAAAPPAGPTAPVADGPPPADAVPGDEAAWPYPTAPLPAPTAEAPPPLAPPPLASPPAPPLPPPPGYGYPPPPAPPTGQWGGLPYAASTPDYTYVPAAPPSASRRNLMVGGGAVAAVLVLAVVALAVIGSKKSTTHRPTVSSTVASQQVASALLATVPAGYVAAPSGATATGPLDAAAVAKLEQDPVGAARALARYGFEGAFARGWSRQAKPGVIVAIGYQFVSSGDAKNYYNLYLLAQRNRAGTSEFSVTDLRPADGFTDTADKAITLQTVVLLRGRRVFVVGIGDPSGGATATDATALARTQATSA